MTKQSLSIVISAYNEQGNIAPLYKSLKKELKPLPLKEIELIFVNDGSTDATLSECLKLQKKDPSVKIVNLKRNFGHEIAMTAGMDYAKSDAVIFMDADLQHPPSLIPEMVAKWQGGDDIILTKRTDNLDTSRTYKILSKIFFKFLNLISETEIPEKNPDFRLVDKKYITFLKNFSEKDRVFRGLLSWAVPQKNLCMLSFVAPKRHAGTSKYNLRKSVALAIDSITEFSVKPLRLSIYLGVLTALFAAGLMIYVIAEHFILNKPSSGYATIMTAITFIGAVELIVLGIVGEYIGKIHMEVKKRPLYFAEFLTRSTKNAKTD